jgi:hypothetical protein
MIQLSTTTTNRASLGVDGSVALGLQASKQRAVAGAGAATSASGGLTTEQQQQVEKLKEIDRKVRAHEQAHLAIGAELVRGGASFTYETGPDKNRYAVAGEVSIDSSPGRTPEETIPKAQHIRATALAPADPSPQDHSVAAQASQTENKARMEVAAKTAETNSETPKSSATSLYSQVAGNGNPLASIGGLLSSFA